VEAQAELVQPPEHVLGQLAHRVLADALEDNVADVVEQDGREAPGGVSHH
jgi:hypothetical protein